MGARIMVVEDEEALTTLLRYNLDAEGYEVETVARGDDADTRLKERIPIWSCWTGCCRACPASNSAGVFGPAPKPNSFPSSC